MKKITNGFLLGFSLLAGLSQAAHLQDHLLIAAKLDGAQQVPAITTSALGVASFSLNGTRDTMCVKVSVNGLSGAITGAHVHEGAAGVSGGVITDLSSFVSGNTITAMLTGASLTSTDVAKYLSGLYYINIHTAANPGGEIRGQLLLETDYAFTAKLDGAQQVPAIGTNAFGLGTFNLSKDNTKLNFYVVASALSGTISSAHLHTGAAGVSGPVAIDLSTYISGNVLSGEIDPTAILTDLKAGNIYINIHTAANAGGEIRGQLKYESNKLYLDARSTGAQQVPAVTTNAVAISSLYLNAALDSLYYDVVADGLSGAITSAHFHTGAIGVSGAVAADISTSVVGNRIMGFITGTTLTTALINDFLKANIYINIHTAANAGGEIRGQVYRLAREGYTMNIDGLQQTPSVTTAAIGAGIVSIDRDQTNAHFMVVASGLSGTASGIHFHNAAVGASGAVIYDLAPQFTSTASTTSGFGYWTSADATPFTTANSVLFRGEQVYINIHTATNSGGEIRGQVERNAGCLGITTDIEQSSVEQVAFSVYPNPVYGQVNLTLASVNDANAEITITDVLGKKIISESISLKNGNNTHSMDVNSLNKGIYFITVQFGNQRKVERLIKQ